MWQYIQQTVRSYNPIEVLVEMAVIWICLYLIFRFLRGTRGAGVIKGLAVLFVILTLAIRVIGESLGAFGRLTYIYDSFISLLTILLIVVFQPELRQVLIRMGRAGFLGRTAGQLSHVIDSLVDTAIYCSKNQFGALIAMERSVKLGGLVEGGEALEAKISARLLESIFYPNSPLHDLGVVVRGDLVIAANVQFPIAEDGLVLSHLGSRHRAAVGLSLESDCVVLIVSEETGGISLAEAGQLDLDISRDQIRAELEHRLQSPLSPAKSAPTKNAVSSTRPMDSPSSD